MSQLDRTIHYIREQKQHHRKMSFQEEFLALLKKHRIAYDERSVGVILSRPFGTYFSPAAYTQG